MTPRKSLLQLVLTTFILSVGIGCAGTGPRNESEGPVTGLPFFGKYRVHRTVLPNGLKLMVLEDHTAPTFAIQTWYKVGSKNEVENYTGLAHLFEHMMFKRTKNTAEGEFDRVLEQSGAEGLNAYTNTDHTVYIQELPSDKLELILKYESDRMVNLIVDEAAFKTEREVVQNERRFRTENNPDGLIYQTLGELAFKKHPYHWPVIGYEADLERMTAKDAEQFYRSHYAPNRAVLIIVGDVTADSVQALVEKYYGGIPASPAPILPRTPEPDQTTEARKTLTLNIQNQKILMGYKVPPAAHADAAVLEVIQSILTGGKSSRLKRALVDSGIASSVDSGSRFSEDPGLFLISAELQKGKPAATADQVIQRELKRLADVPVPAAELQKSKNLMNFGFYDGLSSHAEKARFIGTYETLFGDYQAGLKLQDAILRVTSADVQRVARSYFKTSSRTVIVGVPK
jgi:predicted Zn-dependent peptidase